MELREDLSREVLGDEGPEDAKMPCSAAIVVDNRWICAGIDQGAHEFQIPDACSNHERRLVDGAAMIDAIALAIGKDALEIRTEIRFRRAVLGRGTLLDIQLPVKADDLVLVREGS